MAPWLPELPALPTKADTGQLASLTIRKILCFREETYKKEISALEKKQLAVKKDLSRIKEYTIKYLQDLLNRYAHLGKRKTQITQFKNQRKTLLTI